VKTSTAVQINHVVALGDMRQTGAATRTPAKRLRYTYDPTVLLAVDGPSKESKGDDDASEWLPQRKAYDCTYVAKQITIKAAYARWTAVERFAMAGTLETCS
jgi:hypothetical protein